MPRWHRHSVEPRTSVAARLLAALPGDKPELRAPVAGLQTVVESSLLLPLKADRKESLSAWPGRCIRIGWTRRCRTRSRNRQAHRHCQLIEKGWVLLVVLNLDAS